ncbi:hypothetical protein ABVK25_012446 [Lepraria finkii]|uniref:Uncharacterized protein n=1 Tax=Lepraria finkii TaxID=1340010 RepID=A0ABR4AG53_9LECA
MRLLPNYKEQDLLQECWTFLLDKYRTDIRTLTENLQEKYIEASEAWRSSHHQLLMTFATKMERHHLPGHGSVPRRRCHKEEKHHPSSTRSAFITPPKINPKQKKPLLATILKPNLKRKKTNTATTSTPPRLGTPFQPTTPPQSSPPLQSHHL